MPPASALALPRTQRVKQARDFNRLKNLGRRATRGCLIANWMTLAAGTRSRIGVITTKAIGNAVVRSRARRLLREAFRLNQGNFLQPLEMVLVARRSIVGKPFSEVENDFLAVLRQARLLPA